MRIESQPAYVLHTRNYRDTSLLVEFLTFGYGRVSAVVKGVRSSGKTAKLRRSLMQPFIPLLISWTGKTDLKTIIQFESCSAPLALVGPRLFSAIYVNELLTRLLQHYDNNPELYSLYQCALQGLLQEELIDVVLRRFELQLLDDLGYGIDLTVELDTERPIEADKFYLFESGQGFCLANNTSNAMGNSQLFSGEDLLAIARGDFCPQVRRAAKRLCRQALAVHLGNKPLKSRELFG
ncbi:MAG: DNA repair protein RecO [Pseudomonadales bacterium]